MRLETSHVLGILSWRYSPLSPFPLPDQQPHLPTWRCKHGPPDPLQEEGCSVQSLSHVRLFATPWTAACQASLSIANSQSLLKLMSIESVMPPNYLIFCCPLLLPPLNFPSIRVFSNESLLCIRWPKYWSVCFSISPSEEYSVQIFKMNWLGLLAVKVTLKSLLQHHSSKASVLRHSTFFRVWLSHPYMTTGKAIVLTRRTFVSKVMSLLFNMLSGWHHWLNGREFEWTLGVGDGQEGLACCDSWGHKESDTTEWLNWNELN